MKDLSAGQDVIDAAMAQKSWVRRNRPWLAAAGYGAVAVALGFAGRATGAEAFYKVLALMGEPLLSMTLGTLGPWPALVAGVLLNATAIGMLLQNLDRFSIRMEGAGDLALRVLGRDKGSASEH
jgi:hypothetical protein